VIRIFFALILAASIASCGYPALRDSNRTKLAMLEPGMSREQVVSIMGTDGFGEIRNPYKRETFSIGEDRYEVLNCYADFIQAYQPMETGMPPVILKNGKYIGSGKEFLFKIRRLCLLTRVSRRTRVQRHVLLSSHIRQQGKTTGRVG